MEQRTPITLRAAGQAFVVTAPRQGSPQLVFWGPASAYEEQPAKPAPPLPSGPDERRISELAPLEGYGFFGEPALLGHIDNGAIFSLRLEKVAQDESRCTLSYGEARSQIELALHFAFDPSGVLVSHAEITNNSQDRLHLQRLNALTLPLPSWARIVDLTYGGWSSEGHSARIPLAAGKVERTSRSGRPGFDGGPHLVLTEDATTEMSGCAIGLALAHSGNFTLAAERFGSGEAQAIAAEWLHPGEVILSPGKKYETPAALGFVSINGVAGVSRAFHDHARAQAPATRRHRPVQLNSWEAVYFGIDEATAMRLADEAAAIGAERFVLDDGWFKGRHHDRTALGDWTPDPVKFPNGLRPLAEHVVAQGLEFGLWVEPEMVNEDSDLFRAHPDWILSVPGLCAPTARHQLVLDLSRKDVREYLFSSIDALLDAAPVSYLKWDCNRDLFPAATAFGAAAHKQVSELYALLDRIRASHPEVAIESCASGGGRMDFGVLQRADRFWTSDATDALERIRIQRRASLFYPLEMLGAHVGSSPNHWSRRDLPMAFRCLTALFGHFGVELDPGALNEMERSILKRAIELYKEHRSLISEGALLRFDNDDPALDVQAILAPDKKSALLRVMRCAEPDRQALAPVRLPGFESGRRWHIKELALEGDASPKAIGEYSAAALAYHGLDLSPAHVAQGRLFFMESKP
ncbi:MAG: alpha-galactosidase [Pseudomonadota bacterium]